MIKVREIKSAFNFKCRICKARGTSPEKIFFKIIWNSNRDVKDYRTKDNNESVILCQDCLCMLAYRIKEGLSK